MKKADNTQMTGEDRWLPPPPPVVERFEDLIVTGKDEWRDKRVWDYIGPGCWRRERMEGAE